MSPKRTYFLYILASRHNGTLYVGVTNDLISRVSDHKEGKFPGFTKKYKVKQLVYYEEYEDIRDAIEREKCIKEWKRFWKIKLIKEMNPTWKDLYGEASRLYAIQNL